MAKPRRIARTCANTLSPRLKVGVNFPWYNYGWDFGPIPPGYGLQADRGKNTDDLLRDIRRMGIFAVRWFILCDGLNYGVGDRNAKPREVTVGSTKEWRFDDPPALTEAIKNDFKNMLEKVASNRLLLLPSFVDFHMCFVPDAPLVGTTAVKGCRYDLFNDKDKRKAFFERALKPLLAESKPHKESIYAWEIMNEPEWATIGSGMGDEAKRNNKTVYLDNMKAFLREGVQFIKDYNEVEKTNFATTIGYARRATLDSWGNFGATIPQFHYYPKRYYPKSPDHPPLTPHDNAKCIIGEFASKLLLMPGHDEKVNWSSAYDKDWWWLEPDTLHNRLVDIDDKGYIAAFVWSVWDKVKNKKPPDEATDWSDVPNKKDIMDFIKCN